MRFYFQDCDRNKHIWKKSMGGGKISVSQSAYEVCMEIQLIIIKQSLENMFFCPVPFRFDAPALTWFSFQPFQSIKVQNFYESVSQREIFKASASQDTKDIPLDHQFLDKYPCFAGQSAQNQKKKEFKEKRVSKKIKIKEKEQQSFDPRSRVNRKKSVNPQNQNRNVIPNIMHQAISFLHKKAKSGKMVEKLIIKMGLTEVCSVGKFFTYQKNLKEKLNHYLNAESVRVFKQIQYAECQYYSEEEQRHYNKISRLLIQHYLENEFASSILTSRRVCSEKKYEHLVMRRQILEQIGRIFRQ